MNVASTLLAMGLFVVAAQPAAAQPSTPLLPEPPWGGDAGRLARLDTAADVRLFANPGARTLAFISDEMGQERVVRGAPYCADAAHESVQTLSDGNRIVRKQLTRLCRDGEGRTRQELEHDGQKRVYLRDPVAKEAWLLDPERKTARRLIGSAAGRFDWPLAADGAAWRDYAERMRAWARAFSERMHVQTAPLPRVSQEMPVVPPGVAAWSGAAHPVVIVSGDPAQRLVEAGDAKVKRHVDVQVLRSNGRDHDGLLDLPPMPDADSLLPSALAQRLPGFAPRGPGVLSPLGSKELEGVRVNGERTTWTIEPGRLGNEKPIVITRDVWTSPELLITLQTREFDPRSGDMSYRLSNLRRGEPDPALMKPPPDYDTPRGGSRRAPPAAPPASGRG